MSRSISELIRSLRPTFIESEYFRVTGEIWNETRRKLRISNDKENGTNQSEASRASRPRKKHKQALEANATVTNVAVANAAAANEAVANAAIANETGINSAPCGHIINLGGDAFDNIDLSEANTNFPMSSRNSLENLIDENTVDGPPESI